MILALLLLACSGPDDDSGADDTGCGGSALFLGSSAFDADGLPIWIDMPAGSDQTMVHGPQGGWHLLAAADVRNTESIVTLTLTVDWVARSARISSQLFRVLLVEHENCGGYFPQMYAILDVAALVDGERDTPPELLAGETLRVELTAEDGAGTVVTDRRDVVAALDPMDEAGAAR